MNFTLDAEEEALAERPVVAQKVGPPARPRSSSSGGNSALLPGALLPPAIPNR